MQEGSNRRIARNTLLMYFRMFLLICINFAASRVLLQKLGVDDFGLYGLVGSVVALFSSVRGLFITSTQRFLNYEMGRGATQKLSTIFNTSMIVNVFIAIIFALAVEAVGLWFIKNEINVVFEKIFEAEIVLHLSVLTAVITILTTPYDALLIAHENISAYAYLSIIDNLLRLGAIFLLDFSSTRLVFYAFLLLLVAFAMRMIYSFYCHRHYTECRLNFRTDRQTLVQMTSFAGWQFFGNTAFTLTHNGLNMLLNVFGGTACNAARTIAYQAYHGINQLVSNMALVISPQSVKSFASNDNAKMMNLFFFSSKVMFLISYIAILPVLLFTPDLINFWMGVTPQYSVVFIQIMMYYSVFRALHSPIDTLFKSIGQIKQYQFSEGIILAIPVPLTYIMLKSGFPVQTAFILVVVFELLNLQYLLSLAKKLAKLNIIIYVRQVLIPAVVCIIFAIICEHFFADEGLSLRFFVFVFSELVVVLYVWVGVFTETERSIVSNLGKTFLLRKK